VCVGLGNQSITEFVVSLKTLFLLNEIRVERRRLKKKKIEPAVFSCVASRSLFAHIVNCH